MTMSSKLAPALILASAASASAWLGNRICCEVALLGRAEARILAGDPGVGGFRVRVADLGRIGERLRLERDDVHRRGIRARGSSTCGR